MRRRRCQRLLKVLRWDIITLMALLEQLVLPAEDPSFTRFSFFLDRRESTLRASTSLLFEDSRRARSSFWILLNSERGVDPGVTKPATVHVTWIYADYLLFFLQLCLLGPDLMHLPICRGRHQLVVRLCYDEYDEVGLIHQYYTGRLRGALFPGLIRNAWECAWIWTRPD